MTLEELLRIRKNGRRPDGIVVLSLCGKLPNDPWYSCVIEYRAGDDLRALFGLRVIIAGLKRHVERMIALAGELEADEILLWNVETNRWVVYSDNDDIALLPTPPMCFNETMPTALANHARAVRCMK